jgi:hypothetical protein
MSPKLPRPTTAPDPSRRPELAAIFFAVLDKLRPKP